MRLPEALHNQIEELAKAIFAKYGAWSMALKWTKTVLSSVDGVVGFIAKDIHTRVQAGVKRGDDQVASPHGYWPSWPSGWSPRIGAV